MISEFFIFVFTLIYANLRFKIWEFQLGKENKRTGLLGFSIFTHHRPFQFPPPYTEKVCSIMSITSFAKTIWRSNIGNNDWANGQHQFDEAVATSTIEQMDSRNLKKRHRRLGKLQERLGKSAI
ncbi:hypothetical protein ABFS83_08G100800 [Erythranthe nasuta]